MYEGHKFVFERTFMKNVLYIDDKSVDQQGGMFLKDVKSIYSGDLVTDDGVRHSVQASIDSGFDTGKKCVSFNVDGINVGKAELK